MSIFDLFKRNYYQEMTRASDAWWNTIYKPSDFYDKIELDLTVHICGSEEIIEKKYEEVFGVKVDYDGTAGLANIDPRDGKAHIFFLSTEIAFATQENNYFSIGHEMAHIIDFHNEQQGARTVDYPNPDELHKGT